MTERDNEARIGVDEPERASLLVEAQKETTSAPEGLSFPMPTEQVDLPSRGLYYPDGHPFAGRSTVEIRYMTAKEEDILVNRSLLKKGVALNRLVESVLIEPKVSTDDMLIADKNAILIAARITGYGSDYETSVVCQACEAKTDFKFDLEQQQTVKGGDASLATVTENGTWKILLPRSKWNVEVRLLSGRDERSLTDTLAKRKKNKQPENTVTEQMKLFIVSINDEKNSIKLENAIESMIAVDARHLRKVYAGLAPSIELRQPFKCSDCDFETEMEVPFNTDFFWSKR